MAIELSEKSNESTKVGQICRGIRRMISEKNMEVGDKIPSEQELCEIFSSSKMTVVKAMENLTRQGLLHRKRGVGTRVRKIPGTDDEGTLKIIIPADSWRNGDDLRIKSTIRDSINTRYNIDISTDVIPSDNNTIASLKEIYHHGGDKIKGVFYFPSHFRSSFNINDRAIRWFKNEDIPYVILDRIRNAKISNNIVYSDNVQGGRLAAQTLIKGRYKKYVFIYTEMNFFTNDRQKGFIDELKKNGIKAEQIRTVKITSRLAGWKECMRKIIGKTSRKRSLGIFANTDELANVMLLCMNKKGIVMPKESGLIGFHSGGTLAEQIGLSHIKFSPEQLGNFAYEMLMQQIKNPLQKISPMAVPVTVVRRKTTPFK